MKKLILLISVVFSSIIAFAQPPLNVKGAWQMQQDTVTYVWILADDCYMTVAFSTAGNRFISATGGKFKTPGSMLELEVEFNSKDKNDVGGFHLLEIKVEKDKLTTKHHEDEETWKRIDDGMPGSLNGAWLFSGRKNKPEDEIAPYTPGARKTMKIMSGTRFQWAAFNTETKEFFGTGGGTYTTKEGKYTENIDVFSRDNSRVGASLSFDMVIAEPHWNHSGKSSKGDPIYERWSRRKSFAGQ
jgi:hypothetical protein